MANLILTTNCQRNCPYCFAQEDKTKNEIISWDNFLKASAFIASGPKIINLLGGEPTLHQDFSKMLEYLLFEDFNIQVFTNGLVSKKTIDSITRVLNKTILKENQLYFAVNFNEAKYRSKKEFEAQIEFSKAFNKLVYPTFTIHEAEVDLTFLLDIINECCLDKTIRLGLALPVVWGKNKYLPIEDYEKVAKKIIILSENAKDVGIKFDCGFPLCMFTLDELVKLGQNSENDFAFICGQPLDIYPDLTVANCYPLSKVYKEHINNFSNITELYKFFDEGFSTPAGIYGEKCKTCTFFRKACFGGCKAFYRSNKGGDI